MSSIIGVNFLGGILIMRGVSIIEAKGLETAYPFFVMADILIIYTIVIFCIFWYKSWRVIQDGNARTTPAKAVSFLFIPLFNLYWVFQAFWGFSKDYNSYIKRHGITLSQLPEWLFLAESILVVSLIIPIIGSITAIINLVILAIIIYRVCDAVNGLKQPALVEPQQ